MYIFLFNEMFIFCSMRCRFFLAYITVFILIFIIFSRPASKPFQTKTRPLHVSEILSVFPFKGVHLLAWGLHAIFLHLQYVPFATQLPPFFWGLVGAQVGCGWGPKNPDSDHPLPPPPLSHGLVRRLHATALLTGRVDFAVFKTAIAAGGIVKAFCIPDGAESWKFERQWQLCWGVCRFPPFGSNFILDATPVDIFRAKISFLFDTSKSVEFVAHLQSWPFDCVCWLSNVSFILGIHSFCVIRNISPDRIS